MVNKMKKTIILFLVFLLSEIFAGNSANGTLKGIITDADTKQPLPGVNIIIKQSDLGTSSDINGNFIFENLPSGTYILEFSFIGYKKIAKTDVIIKPGRTNFISVEMFPTLIEIENVVVQAGYFSSVEDEPLSVVNFSAEEIRRAPGAAGDVSRIMYGLPAIAKINDARNSLIVRGGSAVENTFYIDNIEIPNINHYPVDGASDGPIGILNADFIEDANLHTGGFSPVYGDRMSSIMQISYREGNSDNFIPQLTLSLAGFGASVEGPIGKSGNYMFSVNKSYLDLVVDKAETGGALPIYGDAQGKITYKLSDNNKISLIGIFSQDEIQLDYEDALESDLTNVYGKTNGITNLAGINLQHLWGNKGYSDISFAHTYNNYDKEYYETKSKNLLYINNSTENTLALRNVNLIKTDELNSIEFGIDAKIFINDNYQFYGSYTDKYNNTVTSASAYNNFHSFKGGIFSEYKYSPTESIITKFGFRADAFEANNSFTFSPRFTIQYYLDNTTSFTYSSGKFHQEIPNHLIMQNGKFSDLKTPYSLHNILGFSKLLSTDTRLTIEGYYKRYYNMPLDPAQPHVFIIDESASDGIFRYHENLSDQGEAESFGAEVMVQKKLAENFYGLAAGSISKSKYKDVDGNWHDRIYDNLFNINIEGGYILNDEWEFKLRWTYAGGAPYTPFDIDKSTDANAGIWDLSKINSERLPDYHSLNIRVDKRFYFNSSNLILYLSIWNAYGRENIAQYIWDEVRNKQGEMKQWNTLPVIGIEYEF